MTWKDTARIEKLRRLYAQRPPTATVTSNDKSRKGNGITQTYCAAYQRGSCQHEGDHASPSGFVRHFCAYGWKHTKGAYTHTRSRVPSQSVNKTAARLGMPRSNPI
jgi:hypothetical protein